MDEQEPSGIAWQEIVGMLLRRRMLIVSVFAGGLVTAVILALLQGPSYRASATLMVTSKRARITVSPDPREGPTVDSVTDQDLNSEVALLQSPSLVREVLESYPLAPQTQEGGIAHNLKRLARLPFRAPSLLYQHIHGVVLPNPLEQWVEATAEHISVAELRGSNMILVSYESPDPQWAAEFVNKLVNHHVERHVRLNQQADAVGFFESQRQLLQATLHKAEEALAAFYQREGIDTSAEQRDVLRTRVGQQTAALASAETELSEATARTEFLTRELRTQPKDVASNPKLGVSSSSQMLKNKILELELQRSELLSKYTPGSLKVQEMDRQITEAKHLLASQEKTAEADAATNPVYQQLNMDLAQARSGMAAVKARGESLRAQIATDQGKLEHLDTIASGQEHLEQEVKSAKEALLTYTKKREEARFSEALDESGIVNVNIVEPAEVPNWPLPTKQLTLLLLGSVTSLFAGLVLAFVRDRLDPTVKTAAEARRLSGLPILVDIAS